MEELRLRWDMASIILVWERGLELGLAGARACGAAGAGAAGTENGTVQGMGLAGNALCISGLPGMGDSTLGGGEGVGLDEPQWTYVT
jgi:hypothetical protein